MKRKRSYHALALGALTTIGGLVIIPGCGDVRKLVSLQVTPSGFIFPTANPGASGQFRAVGTYIHPPSTIDVTDQAVWTTDDGVVSVTHGLVVTIGACGSTNVTATMPEGTGGARNIVRGSALVVVHDPGNPLCP